MVEDIYVTASTSASAFFIPNRNCVQSRISFVLSFAESPSTPSLCFPHSQNVFGAPGEAAGQLSHRQSITRGCEGAYVSTEDGLLQSVRNAYQIQWTRPSGGIGRSRWRSYHVRLGSFSGGTGSAKLECTYPCQKRGRATIDGVQTGVDVVHPGSFITQDQSGGHANLLPADGSSNTGTSSSTSPQPILDVARGHDRPATPVSTGWSLGPTTPPSSYNSPSSSHTFGERFEDGLTPATFTPRPAMSVAGPSTNDRKRCFEAVEDSEGTPRTYRPQKKSKQLFK